MPRARVVSLRRASFTVSALAALAAVGCAGASPGDSIGEEQAAVSTAPTLHGSPSSGFVNARSGVNSTLSIAKPASTSQGDLLVALVSSDGGQYASIATPGGWTAIKNVYVSTAAHLYGFYKIAGASEPSSYGFGASGSEDMAGGIFAVTGAKTSAPIDVSAVRVNSTASTTCTVPPVTTNVSDTLVLASCAVERGSNLSTLSFTANGMTKQWSVVSGGTYGEASMGASATQATAGTTPAMSATMSAAKASVAITIAVAPSTTTAADAGTTADAGSPPSADGGTATDYDTAIAYTQTRPAFTPTRTIDVASASALKSAIANLQPGDLVKATAAFTVSGETVISKQLASWAVLDLGGYVTFEYSGGSNLPAVYLNDSSYLRIYGGIATTDKTGGGGILSHGMNHVLWWGFRVHDTGGTCVSMFPASDGGSIDHVDLQGEMSQCGLNLAWDPHAEKGTGLHGANLEDNGQYPFHDNRFAFYVHDEPAGAAVEYGSAGPNVGYANTLYLKAINLTDVATQQTGGNGLQLWGVTGLGLDAKYIEVANAQGRAVETGGMYSGASLAAVTVEYGRASNTNLNPQLDGGRLKGYRWDTEAHPVYQNVAPTP